MMIYDELGKIASATYGLGLKDPVFYALDKLVTDSKFGLLKTFLDDDYAEFDKYMDLYYDNNTTCRVIANFMKLIQILNGRRAYFGKETHGIEPLQDDNVVYWTDMLAKELIHSGNRHDAYAPSYGIYTRGDGQINGSKIRAAIYHILDILSSSNTITVEEPFINVISPFCIFGREFSRIMIYGTEDGIGYLNESNNKYYIDLVIKDIFSYKGTKTKIPIEIGHDKLYSEQYVLYEPENPSFSHSLYEICVSDNINDISTNILIKYNAIREETTSSPDDYDYELYGTNNTMARTLLYKGTDEVLAVPEKFETGITKTIGPFTFTDTKIKKIYIVDGITSIE